jgi:hypothetical protein
MCQTNLDPRILAQNSLVTLGREAAIAHHETEAKRLEEQGKGCHPLVADRWDMMSLAHEGAAMLLRTNKV